ncbi:MAG: hypothetical protein ACI8TF_000559 [Paracoccaceae bacterium]|jgi:hypothetical protein
MLFSNWKLNTAFEAIFCLLCAVICFLLEYQSMFALSIIFLFALVPVRAFSAYFTKNRDASNE